MKLLVTICAIISVVHSQQFEKSKELCKRCNCIQPINGDNDTLVLDCSQRHLKGVPVEWPPHSKHFVASFSYNNISILEQMPASNADTISLTFNHCGIRKLRDALFIDAPNVQFLDLGWNLLTGDEFGAHVFRARYSNTAYEPIELIDLNLEHNCIESLAHRLFEHTPKLKRLNLRGNPLTVLDAKTTLALSSILGLKVLNLANTSLSNITDKIFSRMQKLKELDLSGNKFTTVPRVLVEERNTLEILYLNNNPIEVLDDESFMGLHFLRELNISGMEELHSIRHNTFANLRRLRTIFCNNNPKLHFISEEAFGTMKNMSPLVELYLNDNNLETLYPHQYNWSYLDILELKGNRWLCDCHLYETIIQLSNITLTASCYQPIWANGITLNQLKFNFCNKTDTNLHPVMKMRQNMYKTILATICILLCLVGCYVFWRILLKYKSLRSMNMMYPVMYVSAPTADDYRT